MKFISNPNNPRLSIPIWEVGDNCYVVPENNYVGYGNKLCYCKVIEPIWWVSNPHHPVYYKVQSEYTGKIFEIHFQDLHLTGEKATEQWKGF